MPESEGHDVHGFIVGVGGDQPARIPTVDVNGQAQGYMNRVPAGLALLLLCLRFLPFRIMRTSTQKG